MKENEVIAYKGKYRKFIITYFLISIILLIICAGLIIYVDPFYHYHEPLGKMQLIQEKEAYQNVGIARNCEYDAILTGSSMTENFRASQFDKLFECNTIKLPFGCDMPTYIAEKDAEVHNKIPGYLYDDNIFTDAKYVLNKKVLFDYALSYIKCYRQNLIPDNDYAYVWYQWYQFSKNEVLKTYSRPQKQ